MMDTFKIGDEFIYFPCNKVCLLRIIEIEELNNNEKCRQIKYKRFTYENNTYNDDEYEIDTALVLADDNGQEYIQIDCWVTYKYCIRHVIYHENHL